MKKTEIIAKITEITNATEKEIEKLNTLPVKELQKMLSELKPKEEAQKAVEEAVEEVKKAPAEEKAEVAKAEVEKAVKKVRNAQNKAAMIARVDAWAVKTGVETKLYTNYPHVRDIKVDGKTVFQLWMSANGARMCTRTSLIPEGVRPEGATIIKDGFDLSIPTFSEIETELDKYLAAAKESLAAKAEAKKAEKEKKAAEKAEKKAEKEKAKAEKKAAEKVEEPENK